uniref:BTB domain-containing protein n=1 Tax=Sphaeramia orbicularis TaxID=375764 RepID=A0A673AY59_9TELE
QSQNEFFQVIMRDTDRTGEMESVGNSKGRGHSARPSPNFEVIDGLLYRKKLERGFINYREVLDEDRRREAICTFHRRRPGQRHLSLEETYKCVADNYWWEGMYFEIRDFVLGCSECQTQHTKKKEVRTVCIRSQLCSSSSEEESSVLIFFFLLSNSQLFSVFFLSMVSRGCLTKTMASHSADMLNKLRSQREAGLFCDITLRTNGRSYSAHRAVLAAVSDHFQEIFTDMDYNDKIVFVCGTTNFYPRVSAGA